MSAERIAGQAALLRELAELERAELCVLDEPMVERIARLDFGLLADTLDVLARTLAGLNPEVTKGEVK